MNHTVTIKVPGEMWSQVKTKAALQGQTHSQAASEALHEWLKLPTRELPPRADQWLDELRVYGSIGTRTANTLLRERITSRAELNAVADEDLLKIRHFGPSQLLLLYQIGWRAKP